MNVTIRQLRAFVEAYRLRNMTHAADALHVTQSAMSVLIRQLEDVLGVQLFERTPRALRPTHAADTAYQMAEGILQQESLLRRSMREQAVSGTAQLAFTCTPALASGVVPEVLAQFKTEYPGVKVIVHDSADASLIEEVLSEGAEFSLGFFEVEPTALTLSPLVADYMHVVCRADSVLAAQERVTWKDLAGQSLIKLAKGMPLHRQIGQAFEAAGQDYTPAYEVVFLHTALAMIRQKLGIAVLPGYLVRGNAFMEGLVARELFDPQIERSLLVHTRQGHVLSPHAQLFLSLLRARLNGPDAGSPPATT